MKKANFPHTIFSHRSIGLFITICCPLTVWLFVYYPYLKFYLLHIDTASYILSGQMILDGSVPFLDFWDNKPPFVHQLFALILSLAGRNNFIAITVVTLCFNCLSTILLYLIIRKFSSRFTAFIGAFLYPALSHLFLFRDAVSPNAEMYMVTFELTALLIGLHGILKKNIRLMFIAGVTAGIATAFKQPGGIVIIVLMAGWTIYYRTAEHGKSSWKPIMALITGTASVWLMIIGYFCSKGALWDLLFQTFQFNFMYSSDFSTLDVLKSLVIIYHDYTLTFPLVLIPYFTGIFLSLYTLIKRTESALLRFFFVVLLMWHAGDLLGASASGLFFYHYFVQLMPSFIVILVVPNLHYLHKLFGKNKRLFHISTTLYACILFSQLLYPRLLLPSFDKWDYIPPQQMLTKNKVYSKLYGNCYYLNPLYHHPDHTIQIKAMTKIIRSNVPEDRTIFIWGSSPDIYLLANRKPASRFIYASFIRGNFHGLSNLFYKENSRIAGLLDTMKAMLFSDLAHSKPAMIVVAAKVKVPHTAFFWDYLEKNYDQLPVEELLPVDFYLPKKNLALNEK